MSYYVFMRITDVLGNQIELSEESWRHIGSQHPDIQKDEIVRAIRLAEEIRKSTKSGLSKCESRLYYHLRMEMPLRYTVVVVKFCVDGNFVSTAYTGEEIKKGDLVWKKETK